VNQPPRGPQGPRLRVPDSLLFFTGLFLLFVPLAVGAFRPDVFKRVGLQIQVMTALGAALIAASIPGFLHLTLPGLRAGGALAVFVLVYQADPPTRVEKYPERTRPFVERLANGDPLSVRLDQRIGSITGGTYTVSYLRDTASWLAGGPHSRLGYRSSRDYGCRSHAHVCTVLPENRQFVIWGGMFSFSDDGNCSSR
jgi:hypothetical protein